MFEGFQLINFCSIGILSNTDTALQFKISDYRLA